MAVLQWGGGLCPGRDLMYPRETCIRAKRNMFKGATSKVMEQPKWLRTGYIKLWWNSHWVEYDGPVKTNEL